jgi:chemotaxis protein MotB
MWNNLSRILLAALVVAGALIAYLFVGYGRMNEELEQANKQIEDNSHEVAQARKRLDEELARVSREKEAELARLQQTHDEMVKSLEKEMQAGAVTITRLADRLTVNIVDKILFPSGEAAVSDEGRKVLGRVGQVLEQAKDKTIRIEGHTDNVPIGKQLQDRFATNWELSAARATTVARVLQESTKIDAAAFEAVGMGQYHPIGDNRTDKGRAQNRRIEIVLYPRVQALAKELPKAAPSEPDKPKADDKPNKP